MSGVEISLLIVDSDTNFRTGLGLELKSKGFRVTMAPSANRAFEFFPKMNFDFVIAGAEMADGSGLEMIKRLAAEKNPAKVILTGQADIEDQELAGSAGYLQKPFSPLDAIKLIQNLVKKQNESAFTYFLNKRRILTVVSWMGVLGPQDREALQKCLRELTAARPKYVILNLHGFTGYDAVLAGEIVNFQQGVRELPCWLVLCGLSPEMRDRLASKGLVDESEIIANLQAALQYLLEIGMKS